MCRFARRLLTTATLLASMSGAASASLTIFRSGNPDHVHPPLHGPVLDLAGSSAEPEGLQRMVDLVRGCSDCDARLHVAVIRASGAEALNDSFMKLRGVASSITFVITDRDSAQLRDVARTVAQSDIVWFAGGDQCNYIRWIKGTRVHHAVERVYARGGGVGGNSAGLAIQGEVAYDACPDVSADSKTVLEDPFSHEVSLSTGFFSWPPLRSTITDTHFHQRDRLGRLLVFLARSAAERVTAIYGLGVDEGTSVIVERNGVGVVTGTGAAYLIRADHSAEVLQRGKPLTYRGYRVWKFEHGAIDLLHRPASGSRTIDVVDGKITGDPY